MEKIDFAQAMAEVAVHIKRWQKDNIAFVREFLGVPKISTQQKKGLRAVQVLVTAKLKKWRGEKLTPQEANVVDRIGVSVRSGKGTGKDAFTSWAIVWFLLCFHSSKIPMTGPSEDQVKDILLSEISKWLGRLKDDGTPACMMPDLIKVQSNKVYVNGGENPGKSWFAKIRVARQDASEEQKARTLDGWHEDFMMVVVDEAASVSDAVFKAFDTTLSRPVNFVLLIFNPSRNNGYAHETQFGKRRKAWIRLHFDARESELVEKSQIETIRETYGEDSVEYQVNVCGNPPKDNARSLIPYDKIRSCINRKVRTAGEPIFMGVDPARGGEDTTAVVVRKGFKVTEIFEYQHLDIPDVAEVVGNLIIDYEPERVYVDTIGTGAGVYDILRRRFPGIMVPVNVANKPTFTPKTFGRGDKIRFGRLRDELYWRLRIAFSDGLMDIPNHNGLITELSSIKEEDTEDGRLKIESKVKSKRKGNKSPNCADALMLTMMGNVQSLRARKKEKTKLKRKGNDNLVGSTSDDTSWLYA